MAETSVEVKFDEAKLNRIRKMLRAVPAGMPRIMSRGINRTATAARVAIARRIAGKVNIVQRSIRKRITMKKATYSRWLAHLGISSERISLISFKGARQTKKGVTYRIEKSKRKLAPSAFITTTHRGVTGIFKRYSAFGWRRKNVRYPLAWLRGPSLGEIFQHTGRLAKEVQKEAYKKLEKNIDDQVKLALSK